MSNDFKSVSPNLLVRFLLEIVAIVSFGMWGWSIQKGFWGLVLTVLLPLVIAIIWGVFAVPNDPSRSGKAPVAVSGVIRLVIELSIFISANLILFYLNYTTFGIIFGAFLVLHHIISYDRIIWLIKQK